MDTGCYGVGLSTPEIMAEIASKIERVAEDPNTVCRAELKTTARALFGLLVNTWGCDEYRCRL